MLYAGELRSAARFNLDRNLFVLVSTNRRFLLFDTRPRYLRGIEVGVALSGLPLGISFIWTLPWAAIFCGLKRERCSDTTMVSRMENTGFMIA